MTACDWYTTRNLRRLAAQLGPEAEAELERDLPTLSTEVGRFYCDELMERLKARREGREPRPPDASSRFASGRARVETTDQPNNPRRSHEQDR